MSINPLWFLLIANYFTIGCANLNEEPSTVRSTKDITEQRYLQEIEDLKALPTKTSIIMIDRSGSIVKDSDREMKRGLNIAQAEFRKPGDEIVVIMIYAGTDNPGNTFRYQVDIPFPNLSGVPDAEMKDKLRKFRTDLNREIAYKAGLMIKQTFSVTKTSPETHLLASIDKIHDELTANTDSNREFSLYFFSDMIEFSPHRKFDVTEPMKAKRLGKEDVSLISNYYGLEKDCLKRLSKVEVLLPIKVMGGHGLHTASKYYWNEIFTTFGAPVLIYADMN